MVTALQLAQAEGTAFRQISVAVSAFSRNEKYGHALREKPSDSIRIVMENFNSLSVTSGNAKINLVNNLCRNFKVNLLCGCKTQVNRWYLTKSRKFHNLFGIGTKTRNVVAHNITERVCVNQVGGCAMMAMNMISPKVQATGVDGTGLRRWCWLRLGSGIKKMRIVMAYQPSNSGCSTGITAKDQQSRYFCARGDARSPRTIFFEQLIAQLLLWKAIDNNIILLGNFNKNVYMGRIAKRLAVHDLNFVEVCRKHTGVPIPPTF
jgi:hypothetical protein